LGGLPPVVQALLTRAMEQGIPFDQWQREFKKTIEGRWQPTSKTGEPNTGWRARLIYHTNINTAYAAAQYKELQGMKDTHPYWRYRIGSSRVHREEHVAWDGLVIKADDPWWDTHFPPNGYGCNCFVDPVSKGEMEYLREKKRREDDGPPATSPEPPSGSPQPMPEPEPEPEQQNIPAPEGDAGLDGTAPYKPPPEPMPPRKAPFGDREVEAPKGIEPGWAYAPGAGGAQGLLRALAQGHPPLAAAAWEKIKGAALKESAKEFSQTATKIINVINLERSKKFVPTKAKGNLNVGRSWVVGFFDSEVMQNAKIEAARLGRSFEVSSAGIEAVDGDIWHGMREAHHKHNIAVPETFYLDMPNILANPKAVLYQKRDGAILYVFDVGEASRYGAFIVHPETTKNAATRIKRKSRVLNKVRTAYLIDGAKLNSAGAYTILKGSL